jgi:hypothetical protein
MNKSRSSDSGSNPKRSSRPKDGDDTSQPDIDSGWRSAPKEKIIEGEVKMVYLPKQVEDFSYSLIRFVGYALLGLSLFQCFDILVPLSFTDPIWEFYTQGKLVELTTILFLSLLLIFCRREGNTRKSEMRLLSFLSWSCLILSILYFCMIPLGVINTARIVERSESFVAYQLAQQNLKVRQAKTKLGEASEEQLQSMLSSLKQQNPNLKLNEEQLRNQLIKQISKQEEQIQQEADAKIGSQKLKLIKESVKWNLGAAVAGTLFILFWRMTLWARVTE